MTHSRPGFDSRFRAACAAHGRADYPAAEALYRDLLAEQPENGECLHMLSLLALASARNSWAKELVAQAVALAPGNTRWLRTQAHVLYECGELPEALAVLRRLLELEPANASVWSDYGVYLYQDRQPAAAIEAFLHALALDPGQSRACNNLGSALREEGELDGAVEQFERALALDPAYADALSNLGTVAHARCDYARAVEHFLAALALDPNHADAIGHLGSVLSSLNHPDAEAHLRRALTLKPHDHDKQLNLALHQLRHGAFAEGWPGYEARWQSRGAGQQLPKLAQPQWTGTAGQMLRGATILLHAEQGIGDTLQFLRYLPLVLALGARILLEVQTPLLGLARRYASTCQGAVQVIGPGEPRPPFDWHSPLLSLPHAFRTTLTTIPPPLRLTPPEAGSARQGLRVGLVWAGNPKHARDRERSMPLAALAPLFALPGITYVSLQKGPAAGQIKPSALPLEMPRLDTFEDTAAVLDSLDLVIAVDTAVAHLAASQGIGTWILLPLGADWRWHRIEASPRGGDTEGRETSPWYPEAQLFRQAGLVPTGTPPGRAWQPVIARVAAALARFAQAQP